MLQIPQTTVPEEYYASRKWKDMNMDRGGYGTTAQGLHFGCVYDGVSSGGAINAHAAQAFTRTTLSLLQSYVAGTDLPPEIGQSLGAGGKATNTSSGSGGKIAGRMRGFMSGGGGGGSDSSPGGLTQYGTYIYHTLHITHNASHNHTITHHTSQVRRKPHGVGSWIR